MIDRHPFEAHLMRETAISAMAGLVGAVVPGLVGLSAPGAAAVHAMHDVVVGLLPTIFLNAFMSAFIPAVITLWRRLRPSGAPDLLPWLAGSAALALGLAITGTVTVVATIHLMASAFSLSGLAAPGIMLVRAIQAVLVAVTLTPLTIVLLSSRLPHG